MEHSSTFSSGEHYLQADATQVDGLAGVWKLAAGSALRLHAGQAGSLRIAHGRIWATFDDACLDGRSRAGDHFLSRGESIALAPGQTLVIEPFGLGHASSAYFSWLPAAVPQSQPQGRTGWKVQPMADLRQAGSLAARALGGISSALVHALSGRAERLLTGFAMIFVAARSRRGGRACST